MRLQGRVALVTGSSRGIGRVIARCMAREGASVVVNYVRSEEAARDAVREVKEAGSRAIAVKADVADYSQVSAMVEQAIGAFGKVDILVCNAGTGTSGRSVADTPPEEFQQAISNHLIGAYNCIHLLLPYMRRNPRGDILVMSSRHTDGCPPNRAAYAATKAGMEALARCVAKEERYNGIRVNAMAPGLVESEMTRETIIRTAGVKDIREVDARMPFGRMVRAEDVGNLCVFLSSEEGSHISGEVIYLRAAVGSEPQSYFLSGPQR